MKLQVVLDVDVLNSTNESEARECAFKLASSMNGSTKGRPSNGARATITGIQVTVVERDVKPQDALEAK